MPVREFYLILISQYILTNYKQLYWYWNTLFYVLLDMSLMMKFGMTILLQWWFFINYLLMLRCISPLLTCNLICYIHYVVILKKNERIFKWYPTTDIASFKYYGQLSLVVTLKTRAYCYIRTCLPLVAPSNCKRGNSARK